VGFSFTLPTGAKTMRETDAPAGLLPERATKVRSGIAWSSFAFSVLQSVCSFFAALGGLRLLIGAGALAAATQAGIRWDHFHQNWIRIPMVAFALGGALLNLVVLWQIRRLRKRPAAQWRRTPVPASKTRMERVQFVLSWITLVLIGLEEVTHFRTFHHF
jgi:fumarate reductase subunit C